MEIRELQACAETPPQYPHADFILYSSVVIIPFRTICCSIKKLLHPAIAARIFVIDTA